MDPIPKGIGYELPQGLKADIVTVSHEHFDHNNVGFVSGNKPRVIRGLTADKKGWTRVDEKLKDVRSGASASITTTSAARSAASTRSSSSRSAASASRTSATSATC